MRACSIQKTWNINKNKNDPRLFTCFEVKFWNDVIVRRVRTRTKDCYGFSFVQGNSFSHYSFEVIPDKNENSLNVPIDIEYNYQTLSIVELETKTNIRTRWKR